MHAAAATTSASTNNRKQKTFHRAPYHLFEDACDALRRSPGELSKELGYTPTTWGGWKRKKNIPFVVRLACEALVRRHSPEAASGVRKNFLVLEFRGDELVQAIRRTDPEEMTMKGRKYWLFAQPVPEPAKKGA